MNRKLMNEILIDALQLQNEFYDFCRESLELQYPDKIEFAHAIEFFEEGIKAREWNGNIQYPHIIAANVKSITEKNNVRSTEES